MNWTSSLTAALLGLCICGSGLALEILGRVTSRLNHRAETSWNGGCQTVCCCPDDYQPKPCPRVCLPCAGGCPDDYCPKALPKICIPRQCVCPDDYCPKPCPRVCWPNCLDFYKCPPRRCCSCPACESKRMNEKSSTPHTVGADDRPAPSRPARVTTTEESVPLLGPLQERTARGREVVHF